MVLEKTWKSLQLQGVESVLKEINSEYSLEGLMPRLQFFGHLMCRGSSLVGNQRGNPDGGKDWKQKKRAAEDEMVR